MNRQEIIDNKADLTRADLTRANLNGADLSGADLSGADLSGADLSGADLTRADLSGANLTRADLSGANLTDTQLWNSVGNRREIKNLLISDTYHITYTKTHLQIGCKNHPIEFWEKLTVEAANSMESGAGELMEKHLNFILHTIERFPAC